MSLEFLREIKRHGDPDAFVTKCLIPSIREQKLVTTAAPHHDLNLGGRQAKVRNVLFETEGHRRMVVEVSQTKLSPNRTAQLGKMSSLPIVHVGGFGRIKVPMDDFLALEQAMGKEIFPHEGEDASETHVLNLPATLASHWKGTKIVTTGRGNTLLVKISPDTFQKLEESLALSKFAHRYLTALYYLKGDRNSGRTWRQMNFQPGETRHRDPIAAFLEVHRGEYGLMKRIIAAPTRTAIRKNLADRFGESGEVDNYAEIISRIVREHRGESAAQSLIALGIASRYNSK